MWRGSYQGVGVRLAAVVIVLQGGARREAKAAVHRDSGVAIATRQTTQRKEMLAANCHSLGVSTRVEGA